MNNKSKDQNAGTMDWIPEIITTINPSPLYHKRPLGHTSLKEKLFNEAMGQTKNGILQKNMMTERATTGRLWAHIKHIEMKNTIRRIRKQEGTLKEEEKSVE